MNEEQNEIILTGGRITPNVTRRGDVVYRPCCSNSDFVHRVLQWIEAEQMPFAPRFLGIADDGREMTSFLPGTSPPDLDFFNDIQLTKASKIIRSLHNGLSGFPGCGNNQTVCHNDLSPCNFMFNNDMPYAVFDWDATAIGDPLDDVGYAIWMWCNIGYAFEVRNPDDVARQIKVFVDAYGLKQNDYCLLPEYIYRQMRRVAKSLKDSNNIEGFEWAVDSENRFRKHEDGIMRVLLNY